tara:strand:+ start:442 stop:972 length:531 start_codon:yes stop_codon:yes gene_type:complete
MEFPKLDIVINKYAKYVVQQAKSNLTKDKKGGGPLYESIQYKTTKEGSTAFLISFLMEDYGAFVDEGVRGANPSLVKGGYQKAPLSKYKYTTLMPPMKMLANWAKSKNIRFRNAKGQYAKGSNRSMGFALQRSIFAQGMKPTYFISKPFENGQFELSNNMLEAFVQDIDDVLNSKN